MRFRLTGNYGTFEVSRVIEAIDEDAAFEQTGILGTLQQAGWIVGDVDGETWEVDEVDEWTALTPDMPAVRTEPIRPWSTGGRQLHE